MKPHESPRINKKSIRGDSGDSWPVWNRGISNNYWNILTEGFAIYCMQAVIKSENKIYTRSQASRLEHVQ